MGKEHPMIGLNVLEAQRLDNLTTLLMVEEMVPKFDESIKYGLFLDYSTMNLEMYKTITWEGMLNSRGNFHFWNAKEIKTESNIINEQR